MARMITESPLFLVTVGFVVTSLLLFLWFQSNNKRLLPFIIGSALMTILPIITAMLIETKNERIRKNVFQMANCVRQNDLAGLLGFVDPEAGDVMMQIEREMPTYEFSACNVSGFQSIEFDPDNPDQVTIQFNVFVNVNAPRFNNHNGPAFRSVELKFHKQANDAWKVNGFRHFAPAILQ